jgi:hypothetical protein
MLAGILMKRTREPRNGKRGNFWIVYPKKPVIFLKGTDKQINSGQAFKIKHAAKTPRLKG